MQDTEASPLQPTSERVALLQRQIAPERFSREREAALKKLGIVQAVHDERDRSNDSWRKCLSRVAPGTHWSTYRGWRRRLGTRPGPEWERLVDGRVPPPRPPVSPEVRAAVCWLRRLVPDMSCPQAREHLVPEFGAQGRLSDASLHRIWRQAGLSNPRAGDPGRFERIEHFSGGGALALVAAAALESGAPLAAARVALETGGANALKSNPSEEAIDGPRDPSGRFTADYNKAMRAGAQAGEADGRWDTDSRKRARRDLEQMQVLQFSPEILAHRLLGIGLVPMLTDRRGIDGLDGPQGAWLGVLGQWAYMPATLDRTLAELALLGVDQALWDEHGRQWAARVKAWVGPEGPAWLQVVRYIDITREPYWTARFAPCGNVERVGQNMPCLTRIITTGGPGMVLRVTNLVGAEGRASLRSGLMQALESIDGCAVPPEEGWLLVVDAEAAVYHLLTSLQELPDYRFITVLKGQIRKSARLEDSGEWELYRERDRIRSVQVVLEGGRAPAGGLRFRGVEMQREHGRHSHSTLFITSASEELADKDVAQAYLSRWPNQEAVFRNARNGAGLDRSHGYAGELVTNVALEKRQDAAAKAVARTTLQLEKSRQFLADTQGLAERSTGEDRATASKLVQQAQKDSRHAERAAEKSREQAEALSRYPSKTFVRDTTRENIASATTMMVMLLVEWVLREYFGGLKMELRTFIEHFMFVPVTIRTTRHRARYEIQANPRNPVRTEQLRGACAEINRRRLRRDGRLLILEVVDPPQPQQPGRG